jgi:hypothetical protein
VYLVNHHPEGADADAITSGISPVITRLVVLYYLRLYPGLFPLSFLPCIHFCSGLDRINQESIESFKDIEEVLSSNQSFATEIRTQLALDQIKT